MRIEYEPLASCVVPMHHFGLWLLVCRFEGEGNSDTDESLRSWMTEISKLLFVSPLFLPVYSQAHGTDLCLRLNPLNDAAATEPLLRVLGVVLGLSVVRRAPIKHNLSIALAKLLIGDFQPGVDDMQYESPDEYRRLNSLLGKGRQELDQVVASHVNEDCWPRAVASKSRIFQLCQTIDNLKKPASPRSPRSAQRHSTFSRFLGDQADTSNSRERAGAIDNAPAPTVRGNGSCASGIDFLGTISKGPNVHEYIGVVVHKHCIADVKELMAHIVPVFCQIVPETVRRTMAATDLLDYWSGDATLKAAQLISRYDPHRLLLTIGVSFADIF
jgi:hypothetical protein